MELATRDWTVPATEVRAGDRFRSLGSGYLSRPVESVEQVCNCEAASGGIDPVTRERLHYPVVIVTGGGLTSYLSTTSTVTLTDGY